ncbi:hypothetical protein WICPIJ_001082 [Wickerhamomyces pijperi]|uniref:Glucose-signaling factor 2 n=1 Tax=Wickerhamomyces pijperi TaxID=599730 RepID=A0A9P8QCF4_WICPI|nr:hypothetical protein WICPIJ_001082 [Wickerhamomyces pijperi]
MSEPFDDPANILEQEDARIEIYIRFNDDMEKDYCFSVGLNDDFSSLLKIFSTLQLSLRPSIFYKQTPIGFKVSHDPGYLTETGGLLFTYEAASNTKDVELTDKVSDKCWPGQLIIPVWEPDYATKYSVFLGCLAWLYTDLPDYYSPTPGICLTNQISRILAWGITNFTDFQNLSEDILKETQINQSGYWAQIGFFTLHLVKILLILVVFWTGIYNPYSVNPIKSARIPKIDASRKQELIDIGWTGAHRATLDEFKEFYREYKIKELGGIVKASRAGAFEKLRNPGVMLGEGEGFQSDLKDVSKLEDLKDSKLFTLNYEYFLELGSHFEDQLIQSSNPNKDIKDFRRYGPLVVKSKVIKEIYENRKAQEKEDSKKK